MQHSLLPVMLGAVAAFDGGSKPIKTPMTTVFQGVVPATFKEFSRSGKDRCNSSAVSEQTCWTASDGKTVRYGCRAEDSRVFTEDCGIQNTACDQSKCVGNWQWLGEKSGICYDSGEELYQFLCVDQTFKAVAPAPTPITSAATCSQLGWTSGAVNPTVCGSSKVDKRKCAEPSSWSDAGAICSKLGARLCTVGELAADVTKGSGCELDCAAVWASETCISGGVSGHFTAPGSTACGASAPTCSTGLVSNVRCCADVLTASGLPLSSVVTYPSGYYPAYSSDYRTSDGHCGLQPPLSTYTCWTNDEGQSVRMACTEDDLVVLQQACGTDEDCKPSSCSGPWLSSGDILGRCYQAPQGNLYRYACPDRPITKYNQDV